MQPLFLFFLFSFKDPEFHLHVGGLLNPIPGTVRTTRPALSRLCARLSENERFASNPHLRLCIHLVSLSVGQTASLSFREPTA